MPTHEAADRIADGITDQVERQNAGLGTTREDPMKGRCHSLVPAG